MSNNRPTVSIKGRRGTRLALSWRAAAGDPSLPRLPAPVPGIPSRSGARRQHDGCYRLLQIAGIPVRLHRSTLALFAALTTASFWVGSGLAWLAFALLTVMLAHELGHAAFARRLGYDVSEIRLFPLFGQCRYARPYSAFEDAVIAWGGIAAQLVLLVPALATLTLPRQHAIRVVERTPGGVQLRQRRYHAAQPGPCAQNGRRKSLAPAADDHPREVDYAVAEKAQSPDVRRGRA